MMTPPRMTSTPIAAARVRVRKIMSPIRSRLSALARAATASTSITLPCSATSTADRLLAGCIQALPVDVAGRAKSKATRWPLEVTFGYKPEEKGPRTEPSPTRTNSTGRGVERLARCVFHFARPGLLDALDDVLRHRDVIEVLGHLAALVIGPGEELERLGGGRRILRLLVHEDPGWRRHRPRLCTWLVGEKDTVAGNRVPIGVGCSGLERRRGRRNVLAVLVDHVGMGQLVLLGIGVFDVADRTLGLGDVVGDTFIALGADADRPLDRRVEANLRLPLRTDLGQVIGKIVGRTRAVRAMHDCNRLRRQLGRRVELGDGRIVPSLDLAEEDFGE